VGVGVRGEGEAWQRPAGGKVRVGVRVRAAWLKWGGRPGVRSMSSTPGKAKLSTPTEPPD
jgi:hypothetical protein